jgi:hypothetical protein
MYTLLRKPIISKEAATSYVKTLNIETNISENLKKQLHRNWN